MSEPETTGQVGQRSEPLEPEQDVDRVLTIPNALSALRLLGVPLFLWLALGPEADGWAVLLLVAAGATDWLDGKLARSLNQYSRLGEVLDPLADRLYILAVALALVLRDVVPLWFAAALPLRDVLLLALVPLLRRSRGISVLPVHFLGKAATFNLLYAFPLLLLSAGDNTLADVALPVGWAFAVWGVVLYWWAGGLYALQVRRLVAGPGPRGRPVRPGHP